MNIALLTQAVQGTTGSTTDANSNTQGMFLDLLSAMLGTMNASTTTEEGLAMASEASVTEETLDLDKMTSQLETWLQKPEALQWLKSLPQDAYRTFMDAYVGLLAQMSPGMQSNGTPGMQEVPEMTTSQMASATRIDQLTKQTTPVPKGVSEHERIEQHVNTIQRIVTKFGGTFVQPLKEVPVTLNPETLARAKSLPEKSAIEYISKGMNWSVPQIDAETVMYASKGSLPENLQARIEAALQKAPFKSGADGSKVFTVRLYPEQLGELVVKLERQNGELVVKLFASNQEAKQLLQSQVQQLQQTLHPLSQNVRVEVNLTQQALDTKSTMNEGSDQPDSDQPQEQPQEQPKGEAEDDGHPTEDE